MEEPSSYTNPSLMAFSNVHVEWIQQHLQEAKHWGFSVALNQHWDVDNISLMNILIHRLEISTDGLPGLWCSLLGLDILRCKV